MKRYGWVVPLAVVLLLVMLSPLASPHPDGLERVAEDQGFIERAVGPAFRLIPDYTFPGIADERLATIASGLVGIVAVLALVYGLAALRRRA